MLKCEQPAKAENRRPLRAASIDLDTGEMLDGIPVLPRVVIKHFKKDYMIMFQETLASMAMDRTWKLEETRVFLFVLSKTAMGNWMQMTQKAIGETLGMTKTNVSRTFRSLLARGCLESTVQLGSSKAYRVSPEIAWRGSGPAYTAEIRGRATATKKARAKHLRSVK